MGLAHNRQGKTRLERAVRELGFVGAHSYPHWFGLRPDDRACYPFYAKCLEPDVPIQVQAGMRFQRHKDSDPNRVTN